MSSFSEKEVGTLLYAVDYAARKHRSQRRKGSDANPYTNHPLGVAYLLWDKGKVRDMNTLTAAVLHDTVEDTETTLDELAEKFGHHVVAIVEEVTDDKSLPKARRKELQIEHAPHLRREAALIKLADKVYNVRDILNNPPSEWQNSRKLEYLEWAQSVVSQLPLDRTPLEEYFNELIAEGMQLVGS